MFRVALPASAFDASKPLSDNNPMPMIVNQTANVYPTYHAQIDAASVATAATDIATLCGSATKTIYVNRIQITADATAGAVIDLHLYKRTSLDTGGTSGVVATAKHDSLDPAPTAVFAKYTANPSGLGTGVLVTGDHYALPAATSTGYPGAPWYEDFGVRNDESLILRGVNECAAFSLDGQTIPAGFLIYEGIEWTEK